MIKVAGAWEQGWGLTTESEFPLWEFPCRTYEVSEWYMAPVLMPPKGRLLTQVETLQDAIDANPDYTVVWVEEDGEIDLRDFEHPENALYILGRAGWSEWKNQGRPSNSVVIDTPVKGGMLWAHQCIPLVLQHRFGLHK
jgi:hypothetical protein